MRMLMVLIVEKKTGRTKLEAQAMVYNTANTTPSRIHISMSRIYIYIYIYIVGVLEKVLKNLKMRFEELEQEVYIVKIS